MRPIFADLKIQHKEKKMIQNSVIHCLKTRSKRPLYIH